MKLPFTNAHVQTSSETQKNAVIETIKVLAIIVIFFHHSVLLVNFGGTTIQYYGHFLYYGYTIVTIFFITSGFTLTLKYYDVFKNISGENYIVFLKRRVAVVYPLHLITLLASLPVLVLSALPKHIFLNFLTNIFLLQSIIPDEKFYFSFNALSWYLSCLMLLYLIFPFIIFLINRLHITNYPRLFTSLFLVWLTSFLVSQVFAQNNFTISYWILYISPIGRLFNFISGILACCLYKTYNQTKISTTHQILEFVVLLFFLLSFLLIPSIPQAYTYSFYLMPLFTLLLILKAGGKGHMSKLIGNSYLSRFGVIVFPFFIIHQLVIRYFYVYAPRDMNGNYLVFLSFIISIFASYVYVLVAKYIAQIYQLRFRH